MMLEAAARHRFNGFELDAELRVDGGLVALFGPSGSGKTSLVNVIAGLLHAEAARVIVDGETLTDTARGIFVPKHRRRIGYVFQESRLFPHMSVRQNLDYGRWFLPAGERRINPADIIDMLGIGALLSRRPAGLSGGEKQRVAIGRALMAEPRLLLMDEPLASLDEPRKAEILPFIERLRDEVHIPIVYVSHSVAEIARLASTVVMMQAGRVAFCGPAGEAMLRTDLIPEWAQPETGLIIEAQVDSHDFADGLTALRSKAGLWQVPRLQMPIGTQVRIQVRAHDIMLATSRPNGLSALNVLPGRVREVKPGPGNSVDVMLDCGGDVLMARLTRQSVARLALAPGLAVFAVVKAVTFARRDAGGSVWSP